MGCGFSNILTINLAQSDEIHYADERISGTVQLTLTEGKLEVNQIYLKLIGEIGYTTTQTVSDGEGGTTTYTKYHHIPFYSAQIIFAERRLEQEKLVFNQGQYSWSFRNQMSGNLPPTINHPQSYPHVRYYLQAVIDKAWYKRNVRETKYITVFPHVNLLRNAQCLTPTLFGNQNRKGVSLRGTLNKIGIVPGDVLIMTLEMNNPQQMVIQSVDFSIAQSYQIGANSKSPIIFETTLPKIVNLDDQQIKETLSIDIPTFPLPPSYDFRGGLQSIADVHLRYLAKFSVKVQGILADFHVEVPIILGTEPLPDFN